MVDTNFSKPNVHFSQKAQKENSGYKKEISRQKMCKLWWTTTLDFVHNAIFVIIQYLWKKRLQEAKYPYKFVFKPATVAR